MTKKDYIAIAAMFKIEVSTANTFHDVRDRDAALLMLRRLALRFSVSLAADNPRFDRAKFLQACGVAA